MEKNIGGERTHLSDDSMRHLETLDAITIIAISLLFVSGVSIYLVSGILNRPVNPSFYIANASFKLGEDRRSIEFTAKVDRGRIELKQLFINNETVSFWSSERLILGEGEEARVTTIYDWRMGKNHEIKLVTVDDRIARIVARAPVLIPSLKIDIKEVNVVKSSDSLIVDVAYKASTNYTDTLHTILFTYLSFENSKRSLNIFYDPRYMHDESITRAETIIRYFKEYNISINKLNYNQLVELSKKKAKIILILVNPLKDSIGRKLPNAIPAPLVDPDGDGQITDNSIYGKSLLYDWMKDSGLIFISVGSLQPHKRIIYDNGTNISMRDSYKAFDAHLFLTDANGEESIINGSFTLGDYSPIRISGTLGLSYREASFGFDNNALENYGLQYYAYGDYKLNTDKGQLNLTLPVYIQVGSGGWLTIGDEEYWLSDEQMAHDLFLITAQSVWDSEGIPYGWYWDSGSAFYKSAGIMIASGNLETGLIPSALVEQKIIVRVVGIAYQPDLDRGIMIERIMEIMMP